MAPRTLARLPYFLRWLCLLLSVGLIAALLIPLKHYIANEDLVVAAIVGLVLIYWVLRVVLLDIPRLRDAGLSPWLMLLFLVPGAGAIIQILLFALPSKAK